MDTDRNLLFGVLALQADLLSAGQFAEACSAWAGRKQTPLAELLVERGWLSPADRADVEKLLQRKLAKHGGDAKAGLMELTTDQVRQSLAGVNDREVRGSLASPTPPPQGHVLLATTDYSPESGARYTLSRLHATGGIGRVWLARDASLGRDVALKELRPERATQPAVWARFLKEAQVTGQLEHPGIVPVYEVGRRPDDQSPFYTMRFVRGRTLAEAARTYHDRRQRGEAGPLDLRELLTAFVGVCHAVAYAHSRGVLHRDLKPQNVVLGDYGEVIVLDWGLAKVVGEAEGDAMPMALEADGAADSRTVAGQVLGTPGYMAPEQAEGRLDLLDARTDVYGLGAVLYEVLVGQAPFAGPDTTGVLRRVVHEPPVPPRARVLGVPRALEGVCLRALAKRSADRYPSAKELVEDIKHFLADEPVTAYCEPLLTRTGRWARRHRTLVAAASVLLAATVIFLSVLTILIEGARERTEREWVRAEAERERADRNFRQARQAVDDYFTTVSQNKLLGEPGMEPLRKELLEKAQKYYEHFAEQEAANPAVRAELALAHYRLGRITDLIAAPETAWGRYRQAAALFEEVLAAGSADDAWRDSLGQCYNHWGLSHLEHGSMEEAQRHFLKARAILEKLRDIRPAEETYHGNLARVYFNKGLWNRGVGRIEEAARDYEQSRKLQEKLVADNPRTAEYESDLALTLMSIGTLHQESGRFDQALPLYEQTLVIETRLIQSDPRSLFHQNTLGAVRHNLGSLHRQMCRLDQALSEYEHSRTIRARLVASHPDVTAYQHDLGETLNNIGEIQLFLRQEDKSEATWKETEDLFRKLATENPNSAKARNHLGLAHNNLGVVQHQLGKAAEALAHEDKALELRTALRRDNPLVVDYACFVADSMSNKGNALRVLGRTDAAIAAYQQSAAMYDPLIRDLPTTRYRTNQGIVYGNIGYIQEDAEHVLEALNAYEKSRAGRATHVAHKPTQPRFQADLALAHFCIAKVQTKISLPRLAGLVCAALSCERSPLLCLPVLIAPPGEADSHFSPEALANYQKALETQLKLVADFPTIPDYRADLGRTYIQLGNLSRDNKDFVDAFKQYKQSLEVWKPLVEQYPKVAEFRHNLAIGHYNYGLTMQDLRLALLALNAHEEGRKLREVLIKEKPDDKEYARNLASTYNGLGLANLSLRRNDKALEWFDKAEAAWNPVVDREPNKGRHRSNRARAVMNKGITFGEMKRFDDAIAEYQRAILQHREAVDRSPQIPKYRELLGKTYQKLAEAYRGKNKPAEAAEAAGEWLRIGTPDAEPLIGAAAELLHCVPLVGKDKDQDKLSDAEKAERRRYVDRAMELLHEAKTRGFAEWKKVTADANLASIHEYALAAQQQLADANPTLTQYQGDLAACHNNIANGLSSQAEKLKEALAAFERALAIRQKLADANPSVTDFQRELAASHNDVAILQSRTGKTAKALESYRQALAIQRRLADANPAVTREQSAVATYHNKIAELLLRSGKLVEALASYEQARAIQQKLADADPANAQFQRGLAGSHSKIAELLSRTGKLAEALAAYEQTRAIQQKLAGPSFGLASTYDSIGRLHACQNHFADAFAALDQGQAIRQKLADANPKNLFYANELGLSHAHRGSAKARAGKPAEAADELRHALKLFDKGVPAASIETRFERSRALSLLAGLGADAKSGVTTAEAATFAEQAIAALRHAVKAGWERPDELQQPEFNAIRGREEFKKLLVEVETRSGPSGS